MTGFGRLPAFICLWTTYILVLSVMTTASSLIFATYILTPMFPTCAPDQDAVKYIAMCTIRMYLISILSLYNYTYIILIQMCIHGCQLKIKIMHIFRHSTQLIVQLFNKCKLNLDYFSQK